MPHDIGRQRVVIEGVTPAIDAAVLPLSTPLVSAAAYEFLGACCSALFEVGKMVTRRGGHSPYKVANFFFKVRIVRVRIDPEHDIDLITGHFHALDQGTDEVPLARPVDLC